MEWTKEQREQADKVEVFWEDPAFPLPFIKGGLELHMNTYVRADDYFEARAQLTAALDEIERLRSQLAKDDTQMGELAVGGWLSVSQELPPLDLPIDLWIQFKSGEGWRLADCSRTWVGNEGWFWVQGDDGEHIEEHGIEADDVAYWQPQPAPPSGEQAAEPKKLTLTEAARIASGKDMQPPSKPIRFAAVPVGNQERREFGDTDINKTIPQWQEKDPKGEV